MKCVQFDLPLSKFKELYRFSIFLKFILKILFPYEGTTGLKHLPFCINLKDSKHLNTLQVFKPYSGHVVREFELSFREHTKGSYIFTSHPRSHHPVRHVNRLLASSITPVVCKHGARRTRHCWASDGILLKKATFLVTSLLINVLAILSEFGS